MDEFTPRRPIEYADPEAPISYERFSLDYALPQWKDPTRRYPPAAKNYGADRYEDQQVYWSREVMREEWDKLWTRTWHLVGHMNDIPETNCYMRVRIGIENILVVRGEGDQLHSFYNVCQHRGKDLASRDYGTAQQLICPFHRWEFNMDGTLKHISDRETFQAKAICHNLDIPKVKVDSWRGWIFINMDLDAQPLEEFLPEDFRDRMQSYDLEQAIRIRDVVQTWPCNWKLAHEAFNEGYHVRATHPQLFGAVDAYHAQISTFENGHGHSIFQFMSPTPHVADGLAPELNDEHRIFLREAGLTDEEFPAHWKDVPKAIIEGKRRKKSGLDYSKFTDGQLVDDWNFGFFPSTELFLHPEGFFLQSWRAHPSDPEKCIYEVKTYAVPGIDELPSFMSVPGKVDLSGKTIIPRDYRPDDDDWAAGPVVSQDRILLEGAQIGVQSRGFKGNVLSDQEVRIRQWYDEYYRYMHGQK